MQNIEIKQIISKVYNSRLNNSNLLYKPNMKNNHIDSNYIQQIKQKEPPKRICLYKNLSPNPRVSKIFNLSTTNKSVERTKQTSPTSRIYTEYDKDNNVTTEFSHRKSNSNLFTLKKSNLQNIKVSTFCENRKVIEPLPKTTKNAKVDLSYLKKSTVFSYENDKNFDKKPRPLYKKCLEIENAVNKLSKGSLNFASFKQILINNEIPVNDLLFSKKLKSYENGSVKNYTSLLSNCIKMLDSKPLLQENIVFKRIEVNVFKHCKQLENNCSTVITENNITVLKSKRHVRCPRKEQLKYNLKWSNKSIDLINDDSKREEKTKRKLSDSNLFYYKSNIFDNSFYIPQEAKSNKRNMSFTFSEDKKERFTDQEFRNDSILRRNWSLPKNVHSDYDEARLKRFYYEKEKLSKSLVIKVEALNNFKFNSFCFSPDNIKGNHKKNQLSTPYLSTNMVSPVNSKVPSLDGKVK